MVKIYGVNLKTILAVLLLFLNAVMLAYMWLGSVKDFIFSFVFLCFQKRIMKPYENVIHAKSTGAGIRRTVKSMEKVPKVLLLYCTCNDFNGEALKKSMMQDYDNFETVILDDSTKAEYKKLVNEFSKNTGVQVVRRENREGFKAGNLNHFLQGNVDYDYFVVLDSDEILPKDYIQETLKYFDENEKIGVVQAAHKATKGKNLFQNLTVKKM